jgi:hypothetical protein
MKATCLLAVFFVAKVLVLWGRDIPLSPWTLFAYLWQDILVTLLFAAADVALRKRPWIGWSCYGLMASYAAVNVPIARLLSTPMTWPMLRATRGALSDSISYHVTEENLARVMTVLSVALILPLVLQRNPVTVSKRARVVVIASLAICVLFGPMATSRVATFGLHRNVLAILITTAVPRITARDESADWRSSPFGNPRSDDLARLRGLAAGRNVVMIHLESTGAQYLKPFGAAEDPMPNLTALTREAIVFENAYTTYPETIRSFFAVQNSLYPALDTQPEMYNHPATPALAAVVAAAGYRTSLFHSGRFMYLGMESVIRNRGYDTLEDAGEIGGERESSFGIDEPSTVRRILQWIDAGQRDLPFLVSYLPIAGHHPYATPDRGPFPEDDEIGRYRNALNYSDRALGQLLQGLRERGVYDKTLFVIIGDHGEAFGQHQGNYGHTLFVYEENVRVPYIIAAPGLVHEPVQVNRVASLIDTAPTVFDLLGLPIPAGYQGRSLLESESGMALFCTDYSLGLLGLRDGRWKCIYECESSQTWLYDLELDPTERHNVADEFPERAEAYRDHLQRWAGAQKYRFTQSR